MVNCTLISSSKAKADQYRQYLKVSIVHKNLYLKEVQSLDLTEVLTFKAKEAFVIVKKPVLIDDTSLVFASLGNLPGPFIKWFVQELGNKKICRMLDSFSNKGAKAQVGVAFYDGQKIKIFISEVLGSISQMPKGERGFGWDNIFIPDGYSQTRSQMSEKDYHDTSPRKLALKKLKIYLNNHE